MENLEALFKSMLTAHPNATICNYCGKPLGENAIQYVNGEGFCDAACEKSYINRLKWGSQIDDSIENFIPQIYKNTDIDKLPQSNRDKINEIMEWKYNPIGLFLWGDSGSGKTRTILKLTKRLIELNLIGVVDKTLAVYPAGALKANFEDFYASKKSGEFFKRTANVSLLVIDDFGKSKFTESYEGFIFNLIEHRTSNCLPTFITTNIVGEDLRRKFSNEDIFLPFARRIKEFFKSYKFLNQ